MKDVSADGDTTLCAIERKVNDMTGEPQVQVELEG
ncbi:Uncharacterised protein [Chlamydia trachomatis]|nr:Uncharacterised protein [Chlamydia trachomatis]